MRCSMLVGSIDVTCDFYIQWIMWATMTTDESDEENISEQNLPDLLTDFGIAIKIRQTNKLDEEKEVPYWASSHKYDPSISNWGEISIPLQRFEQSGKSH